METSLNRMYVKRADYRRKFHTSTDLLIKKKELESVVKTLPNCFLKQYFRKVSYKNRKYSFYENIIYKLNQDEILMKLEENSFISKIENIKRLQQDIVDIYKVKISILNSYDEDIDNTIDEMCYEQEHRMELYEEADRNSEM